MFILSAWLGAKYYPIPYKWKRIGGIFLLLGVAYGAIWWLSTRFQADGVRWGLMAANTAVIAAYAAICWQGLRKSPIPKG